MEGRPDKVVFQAQGYRDVYYCHSLNEPCVIEYHTKDNERYPTCPNCSWIDELATDIIDVGEQLPDRKWQKPSEDFLGMHTYMCTVRKP